MPSRITQAAIDVVQRSLELAKADPARVGIRLRVAGGDVRPRFVEGPEEGDEVIDTAGGVRVFVAKAILDELGPVVIDVTAEHGNLQIRPLES